MQDKSSSTPQNTEEIITIASIIHSIDELHGDIAKFTTPVGEGGGSRIVVEEDSSSKKEEPEPYSICNDLTKWVLSCGTGKKEHQGVDRSMQGIVRGGEDKLSPMVKLNINVEQMKGALGKLQIYEKELKGKITRAKETSIEAMKKLKAAQLSGAGSSSSSGAQEDEDKVLQELVKEIRKLRYQIPTLHKSSIKDSGAHDRDSGLSIDGVRTNMEIYNLPSMKTSKSLEQSSVFSEIWKIYKDLKDQEKKRLLCFAVFPENEEVKKRTLTYWWEGEELLPQPEGDQTVEKLARDFLDDFVNKGLIEPIHKKGRKKARSYRMNPIVHGVVVKIADKENFFVYDDKGNPTAIFHIEKKDENICTKACLLKTEKVTAAPEQQEKKGNGRKKKNGSKDTKGERPDFTVEMKVKTLFNFNEPFPDLRMESFAKKKEADVAEWLSKMENLKVLHLGRWQASDKHHIEVEKTDFLEGLNNLRNLRLFSLQGVSRIDELTRSIKGLTNLKILDLKACHNLEVLPKEISYLKKLTHLDVSDCYLIDYMPKGLSNLKNLQVLKGFVVGDEQSQKTRKYCSLDGLGGTQKLRELSLNISTTDFPSTEELRALEKLVSLKKLTMSWSANPNPDRSSHEPAKDDDRDRKFKRPSTMPGQEPHLPLGLEKLDLLYFPKVESPSWLEPKNLRNLRKLCIRGGHFGELKKSPQTWNKVETLRLKFLSEVKMSWQELQLEYPNLKCLEKVGCPRITFCPCDDNGVWVKPHEEVEPLKETRTPVQPANGAQSGSETEKDKQSEGQMANQSEKSKKSEQSAQPPEATQSEETKNQAKAKQSQQPMKPEQSTQPKKAKKSEEVEDKAQAKPAEQPKKPEQSAQPEKAKEPEKKKQTEEPKKPEQKSEKTKQSEDAKKPEQSKSESEQSKKPKQSEEAEKPKKSQQSEKPEQSKS